MLRKTIGLALCALSLTAATASAQITNIDDIQVYDATGAPASPLFGQTVTIRGVITVEKNTYNGGTHYIQDATGGINFFDTGFPAAAIGDEFEVTGTVDSFGGELNLSTVTGSFIGSPGAVAPTVATINQLVDNDGSGTVTAADYEVVGTLYQTTGTVVADPAASFNTSFEIYDGTDTLLVFIDGTTGIDYSGVNAGDLYQITAPMVNFNGLLELKPRSQADLVENPGNPAPLISDVAPNPWAPEENESVTFTANISDNGSVASANLYYRSGSSGSFTQVAMSDVGGGVYSATIPGQPAGVIEYYLDATDDTAQITTIPGNAPTSVLAIASGTTSITEVQSTLGVGDASAFVGGIVNVEGIVTVAPGELNSTGSLYVIEEAAGGPWSGILVFESSGSNVFFRGDRVRIAGSIEEFSGTTEIQPLNSSSIELISFGEPGPPVTLLNSTEADTTEAWESVLVGTLSSSVVDTINGGADWRLQTAPGDSTIYIDPLFGTTFTATLGESMRVVGYLDTRFGRNEISPRGDADIFPGATGINDQVARARGAYFEKAYPNPFNPKTQLDYVVPRKGMVELAIFNARGERVRTLVSGEVAAGSYSMTWDGLDGAGEFVGSGVYYARLRLDTVSATVEKLTLIK